MGLTYDILIADDHPLFRSALRQALFDGLGDTITLSEVGSITELQQRLGERADWDLVLLDLNMPGAYGFSGLAQMRGQFPQIPVILISAQEEAAVARRARDFGASGFIPKSASLENIQAAVQAVLDGGVCWPEGIDNPPGMSSEQQQISADFYAGPKIQDDLKAISQGLELTVDYGFLWWIAQPLFWVLSLIHGFVGNWGWSIILLTCLIKLIFFPLSATSYRSMANMRRVAPKLQALREQYGDDRQKMSQGMMELYKKEKINPLGGCLPILVQMPVFIALYWVLMESVEIRQAEWLGWITDLSLKDPYFILPIIMGATMFLQQQLNPTPPDPMQAKVMKMLPIIFTFFFLWFPAGLVLYWVVNNCLSIAQQWYITRQIEKGAASKD